MSVLARSLERRQHGTLLLEIGIAMLVLCVLASTSFSALQSADTHRKRQTTELQLERIKKSVLAFVLVNRRLPCPDLMGTGLEGNGSTACPPGATVGGVPFRTLGIELPPLATDQSLRYGVFRRFPDADLGNPPAGAAGIGAAAALRLASAAALVGSVAAQPGVPAMDSTGHAVDCAASLDAPAFVISWGSASEVGAGLCFPVPYRDPGALAMVSRTEFSGWAVQHVR